MTFCCKSFEELTNTQVYEILKSRQEVFMLEQKILCLDMDDVDYKARHYFAQEDGRVTAYLRAFYLDDQSVKIGRVLSRSRRKGVGKALVKFALADMKQNMPCTKLCVDAQKQAAGFYEKCGFVSVSDEFIEEGIPHIAMELEI